MNENENGDSNPVGPPAQIDDADMLKPMQWICRHCGHHQNIGEQSTPDKCEKCGTSGAPAAV
jgi:hypothetical protein